MLSMKRYLEPIKRFAGIIIGAVIIGIVFPLLTQGLPEETRTSVLMQAIPFVAFFVAILLTFILLVVLSAMRFNGKVTPRTYRPIEYIIILGIVGGVFALFQSFHFVGYKYGFVMLLGATLCFILWSHVVPASAKADLQLPPFSLVHHLIGAVAGVIVMVMLVSSAMAANAPKEPYGTRQRVWNSYDDAKNRRFPAWRWPIS